MTLCSILLSFLLTIPLEQDKLAWQDTYKPPGSIKKAQGIPGYVDCSFDKRNVYVCKP